MGEQKTQNKDSTNIDSNCDKLLMATWQIQLATRDLSPVVVLVDSWIHVLWILAKPQRARNLSSDWVAFNQRSPLFDLQVPHITALPVLFIHLCDWCAASTGYEVWSLPLSTSDANSHESIFKVRLRHYALHISTIYSPLCFRQSCCVRGRRDAALETVWGNNCNRDVVEFLVELWDCCNFRRFCSRYVQWEQVLEWG